MKLPAIPIFKQQFQDYSVQSLESLRAELLELCNNSNEKNNQVNLTGTFLSENEFEITPKWQSTHIRNYETKISYVRGSLFIDEMQRTTVRFTVRPNSVYAMLFFAFPLFGLMHRQFQYHVANDLGGTGALFVFACFVIVPPYCLIAGYYAKKRIKNRFISTFNLIAS